MKFELQCVGSKVELLMPADCVETVLKAIDVCLAMTYMRPMSPSERALIDELTQLTNPLRTALSQVQARVPVNKEAQTRVPSLDASRLSEAMQRISTLPNTDPRRTEMARRASRSYSVPRACVKEDGCTMDCGYVVWPYGERWPARVPEQPAFVRPFVLQCEDCGTDAGVTRSDCPYEYKTHGTSVPANLCNACFDDRLRRT